MLMWAGCLKSLDVCAVRRSVLVLSGGSIWGSAECLGAFEKCGVLGKLCEFAERALVEVEGLRMVCRFSSCGCLRNLKVCGWITEGAVVEYLRKLKVWRMYVEFEVVRRA